MTSQMSMSCVCVGKGSLNCCEDLRFNRLLVQWLLNDGSFLRSSSGIVGLGEMVVGGWSSSLWYQRLKYHDHDNCT